MTTQGAAADPITLEVVQAFLINTVREMRVAMTNATYSPVLSETQDFSCSLVSNQGELVAMYVDLPLHIFPVEYHTKLALEQYKDEIYPGDVFICNDPYTGGPHLNDVLILEPFFVNDKLTLFIANRAHWTDVGGRGGVVGQAREIYEEGLRMPLVKIYDRGVPNQALMEAIFANVRNSEERHGDFLAQVGTCKAAEARLRVLYDRYAPEVIEGCITEMLNRSEQVIREGIAKLPSGEYYYEDYMENTGNAPTPMPLRCKLTIDGDEMTFDFTGSGAQVAGPVNSGPACAYTGLFTMIKSYIERVTPVNGGPMRPIHMILPERSFLKARLPAPAGGYAEVIYTVEYVVLGLLGQVMRGKVGPGAESSASHVYITGYDREQELHWVLYDYLQVGTPSSPETDGSNTVVTFNLGDFSCGVPVERIDMEQPLRVIRHDLRPDSGGPGFRRGGLGLIKEIEVLSEEGCSLTILSEQNVIPRLGASSGYPSALNQFTVRRDGVEFLPSDIPGKVAGFRMQKGDVFIQRKHGGGGTGDPLEREVERVLADVEIGYVSVEQARENYGVVIKNQAVDMNATAQARAQIKAQRVYVSVQEAMEDEIDENGLRWCALNPGTAQRIGVGEADMIEYVPASGSHLKSWVRIDANLGEGETRLGPIGRAILDAKAGDSLWIRALIPSIREITFPA